MSYKIFIHVLLTSLIISLLLVIVSSCNEDAKQPSSINNVDSLVSISKVPSSSKKNYDTTIQLSDFENKIVDTIFQLKEIKERQKYIKQQTKGSRNLQIWIADKPNLTNKYYYIQVGEDNRTNYVTHFNFYVYPDSMRIMFLDTKEDEEITLNEWRKINSLQ